MIGRRRPKPEPFPRDWPEKVRTAAQAHLAAEAAAARRIQARRRRLSQEDAEAIVREEAAARGITRDEAVVEECARISLTSPWWPWLHPRKARAAGWRFVWETDD